MELTLDKSSLITYKKIRITEEYIIGKQLSEDNMGSVRIGIQKCARQKRAIKIIKKRLIHEKKIKRYIEILSKLSHPNIIDLFEVFEDDANFYIVGELCEEDDLFNNLISRVNYNEAEACKIMMQVLSAMLYTHYKGIVHRNLKPENIMIKKSDSSEIIIKIIGWGEAKYFPEDKKMKKIRGSSYYIAPEVLKGSYDEKCDVWSCGVILYLLLCGYPPFNAETDEKVLEKIKTGNFKFPVEEWDSVSDEAKDLIKKMLTYNPEERISISQALKHKWFSKFINYDESSEDKKYKKLSKQAFENMKKFKDDNKFQHAIILFISYQFSSKEDREQLRKQFEIFDKNKDGVISKKELLKAYKAVYGELKEDEFENLMKSVDIDKNGIIDINEFLTCRMNKDKIISEEKLKFAFDLFDRDKNGYISVDEFMATFKKTPTPVDMEYWEKLMCEFDENKDGKLEFEEFKKVIIKFFE